MDSSDIKEKSDEYAKFLRTVLQPNLDAALQKEREVQQEIRDYEELIENLRAGIPTQLSVELGYKKIFCNTTIEPNQHVFVNVGMGFHVEFEVTEAVPFCEHRVRFLRSQVLPKRMKDSETIRQHIRESEMILDAIALEMK
jgi:prefoldin subunit 5